MKKILFLFSSLFFINCHSQLTINTGLDQSQLTNLLQGLGVQIVNVSVNCDSTAYGSFLGQSEVDINHGLIMSTGNLTQIDTVSSYFLSTNLNHIGDHDLNLLINDTINQNYDACVLEFDAIPHDDTLYLNFSFGSDEYPEWVNAGFNDVFAIFLKGDGYPELTNMATLPNQTAVSINNVNSSTNSQYYIDNINGQHIAFDGITSNILVERPVTPDSTYHFKIGIEDVFDALVDSEVMLEAFSVRCVKEIVQMDAGIKNLDKIITVYPNPTHGNLYFSCDVESFQIYDIVGNLKLEIPNIKQNQNIDISSLPKGLYLLKSNTVYGPIVKEITVD